MRKNHSSYKFQIEPPSASLDEINRLEGNGYYVHKEWENVIEMRKKSPVGIIGTVIRCSLIFVVPILALPYFGRTVLDVIFGYKYRAFVTRDPTDPNVF